MRLDVIKITKD